MLIIANPMQRYLAMINLQQSLWKLFLCQKQKATPTDILILQVGQVISVCMHAADDARKQRKHKKVAIFRPARQDYAET